MRQKEKEVVKIFSPDQRHRWPAAGWWPEGTIDLRILRSWACKGAIFSASALTRLADHWYDAPLQVHLLP